MKTTFKILTLFCFIAVSVLTQAKDKTLPAVEDFISLPDYTALQLSPSGEYMAALVPIFDNMNLMVMKTDNPADYKVLTGFKKQSISSYFWASDERIVFNIDQTDGQEALSLYTVENKKGARIVELVAASFRNRNVVMASVVHRLPDDPNHIIVSYNKRYVEAPDLYKLALDSRWNSRQKRNMSMELIAKNPGEVQGWIIDHDGDVRGAVSGEGLTGKLLYKEKKDKEFKTIREFNVLDEGITPLMFDFDNKHMFVASNIGTDKMGVYRYDPSNNKLLEKIYSHETVDVTGLITSRHQKKLLGVAYVDDYPEQIYFDEAEAKFHQSLKNVFKGKVVSVSSQNKDETVRIITVVSDTDPGTYYLYKKAGNKLSVIAKRNNKLKQDDLSEMLPFKIQSRDDLTLRGYITVPKNSSGKKLPLIINPHGGPYGVRDSWGYNPDTQFLASRGYAVVQVNFRGSGGYGRAFEQAGYGGKWGHEMQNDITDTVKYFIDQGIADPERVCIYGGSYGGYATMAGLTFTPDLYKCGVNVVGVTDVGLLFESMPKHWEPQKELLAAQVGSPEDKALMKSMSPIEHVDKIKAPVFIIHGRKDIRVVMEHADMLKDKLEALEKPYEWLVKDNEGHGFRKLENRVEMYHQLEKFFKQNL